MVYELVTNAGSEYLIDLAKVSGMEWRGGNAILYFHDSNLTWHIACLKKEDWRALREAYKKEKSSYVLEGVDCEGHTYQASVQAK